MADYTRSFALESNESPFVDADFTDLNNRFKILSGNIHPNDNNGQNARIIYTGEAIDRAADSILVEWTLGPNPTVYSDTGGPGLFVNGGTDDGKGYYLHQNGSNLYIYQVDTDGATGSNIQSIGVVAAATGKKVGLEIYDIQTSPRIRGYFDGAVVGSSKAITLYADEVVPGLSAIWGNKGERGWSAVEITGLDLGGFSLTNVNGDDVIDHDTAFVINGDFSSTTITSVKIKQTGSTDKTASISSQNSTTVNCAAIDFHASEIFPGDATLEVGDGTDTLTLDVSIDFTGDYTEVAATSITAAGVFKDITAPAVGDIAHILPTIAGSAVSVRAAGPAVSIYPAVPNGSTAEWWHGDISSKTWTVINTTINQYDTAGPAWTAPEPWTVTERILSTYDSSAYVSGSATGVQNYLHTFVSTLGGWWFGRDDGNKDIPEYTAYGLDLPETPVPAALIATTKLLNLPANMVNNFCGQVKIQLKLDINTYDDNDVFFRISTTGTTNDNGFECSKTSIDGRVWLLERVNNVVGGTPRVQGITLTAGQEMDIRFRKSSTQGLTLWINGVKDTDATATADYPLPMTWMAIGRKYDVTPSNIAPVELSVFRFEPGDLSDAEVEDWA